MKYVLSVMLAAGFFCIAVAAFGQSTAPQATPNPAPAAAPGTASAPNAAAAGKRAGCLTAVQGKQGQDRQDQMQLCMAQAHVDCLKQAIDQKVVGQPRKDFIKTCMREE
jgi:hypothetical protein